MQSRRDVLLLGLGLVLTSFVTAALLAISRNPWMMPVGVFLGAGSMAAYVLWRGRAHTADERQLVDQQLRQQRLLNPWVGVLGALILAHWVVMRPLLLLPRTIRVRPCLCAQPGGMGILFGLSITAPSLALVEMFAILSVVGFGRWVILTLRSR